MRSLIAVILLLAAASVQAGIEVRDYSSPQEEARYKSLIQELRCLVCQNENLADSNADLAKDLRQEAYEMIKAGKSNDQIKKYMQARYGDFVLYRPPVKDSTILLWFGPLLLVVIGVIVVVIQVRRRAARKATDDLSAEDRERLARVLQSLPQERDS